MNTRVRLNRLQKIKSTTQTTVETAVDLQTYRMTDAEKKFMEEYESIEEFSKEKGVRFVVCRGDER